MAKPKVEYEVVAKVMDDLSRVSGITPTYEQIAAEMKERGQGSPTKGHILDHMRTWGESKLAKIAERSIGEGLIQSVLAEIDSHVTETENALAEEIAFHKKTGDDLLVRLKASDADFEKLQGTFDEEREKRLEAEKLREQDAAVSFEKVSGVEKALEESKKSLDKIGIVLEGREKELKGLQKELSVSLVTQKDAEVARDQAQADFKAANKEVIRLTSEFSKAQVKLGIEQATVIELKEKNKEVVRDQKALDGEVKKLMKAVSDAEKDQSIAEVKLISANDKVDELKKEAEKVEALEKTLVSEREKSNNVSVAAEKAKSRADLAEQKNEQLVAQVVKLEARLKKLEKPVKK